MPHDYVKALIEASKREILLPIDEIWVKYARKSSESSERQALSIPSQIEQMDNAFPDLNCPEPPVEETKSAFRPGRKKFNLVLDRVEAGEVHGIVAWHPNRLARNEEDAARIIRLVREGKLKLKFVTFTFENTPEGMWLLQNMLSQGQYESSKLARDVKRGTDKKAEQGWFPGPVPIGYDTDGDRRRKGTRTVVVDQKRMPAVKRIMAHALTGNYTVAELQRLAADQWGLRTRPTETRKSGALSYTGVRQMLRNVFYAGYFMWDGELREGNHPPIISMQQYERLQEIFRDLHRGGVRRETAVAFSGIITCGQCGKIITGYEKTKHYKGTGRDATYVYYCCSRNSRRTCPEPHIAENKLLDAACERVSHYRMIAAFRDTALNVMISNYRASRLALVVQMEEHKRELERLRQRDRALLDMRASQEIDKEDFMQFHADYKRRINELEGLGTKAPTREWDQLVASCKAIHFATGILNAFERADRTTQRRMLVELADEVVLSDGKVLVKAKKWLVPLAVPYSKREAEYELVRTSDFASAKQKTEAIASVFSFWCTRVKFIANLISEEIQAGRTVHAAVELPADLRDRLDALRAEAGPNEAHAASKKQSHQDDNS